MGAEHPSQRHPDGELGSTPPTGRPIDVQTFQLYRVVNGRLAEHWEVADVARMMAQLSVDPNVPPDHLATEIAA